MPAVRAVFACIVLLIAPATASAAQNGLVVVLESTGEATELYLEAVESSSWGLQEMTTWGLNKSNSQQFRREALALLGSFREAVQRTVPQAAEKAEKALTSISDPQLVDIGRSWNAFNTQVPTRIEAMLADWTTLLKEASSDGVFDDNVVFKRVMLDRNLANEIRLHGEVILLETLTTRTPYRLAQEAKIHALSALGKILRTGAGKAKRRDRAFEREFRSWQSAVRQLEEWVDNTEKEARALPESSDQRRDLMWQVFHYRNLIDIEQQLIDELQFLRRTVTNGDLSTRRAIFSFRWKDVVALHDERNDLHMPFETNKRRSDRRRT